MKTPQELLEDDMINFSGDINYLEEVVNKQEFIDIMREKYQIEVKGIVNVQ